MRIDGRYRLASNESSHSRARRAERRRAFFLLWGPLIILSILAPKADAGVDLEIESVQISPSRPSTDSDVTVYARIRNNGADQATDFYLSYALYREGRKTKEIEKIPVPASLPRSGSGLSLPVILGKLPEGEFKVVLRVDSENKFEEDNEGNNKKILSFRVWRPTLYTTTY